MSIDMAAHQSPTPHSPTSSSSPLSATSLLDPPNPSLQQVQPPGSILLNRNDPSCLPASQLAALVNDAGSGGAGRSRVASAIKSSFSIKDVPSGNIRMPGPPASTFNRRSRGNSVGAGAGAGPSSSVASSSTSTSGSSSGLHRSSSNSLRSPSVSFAPLPHVPELERRRSITLGVAARSAMLKTQGSPASNAGARAGGGAGGGGKGKGQVLMMTDEEWEEYKKSIQMRNQTEEPPEIHHLVKKGTKKLWKRARRMSSSSNASSSSSRTGGGSPKNTTAVLPGNSVAGGSATRRSAPLPIVPSPVVSTTGGGNLDVPDSTMGGTSPSGRNRNGLISRMKLEPSLEEPQAQSGSVMPLMQAGDRIRMEDEEEDMDDDMSGSDAMSDIYGSSLSESVILEEPENEMEDDDDDNDDDDVDMEDEDVNDNDDLASSVSSSSSGMRRVETPGERRERHRLEEEDEMREQAKIPAYLRRDSEVEHSRYQHVHDLVQEGAATPKERREGLNHVGLTDRLSKLQMGARQERADGHVSSGDDGDQTPRRRTSPKGEHRALPNQ